MSEQRNIAPVRSAMVFSAVLHIAVIALVTFGIPWFAPPPTEPSPPVIEVEMAQVADKTNPPPPKAEQKPEPPKPEPQKPPPQPVAKPEPPKPEPPKPEPPKQAEAAPAPEPEPLPKPKEIAKPVEKPPVPTPTPKAKPEPPKPAFNPNQLAALLDKRIKSSTQQTPPTPAPATPEVQRSTSNSSQVSNLNQPLTISEMDAIRQQIERNWSVPAGAKDAANLIVRIHIALNPDGTLRGPPQIVDQSRMSDDYYRIAAESAVRAIYKSEPLKLPADKYDIWRDIEMTFNPKDMLGG